jgi:hypothetical protein
MKKEPTARNSSCRNAREETSCERRAELEWKSCGEREREYARGKDRPPAGGSEGLLIAAERNIDEPWSIDANFDAHSSASWRLNAASGPP